MKRENKRMKNKKTLKTFVAMGITCVVLGVLVALFMYNKFIGFGVCTIFVIVLLMLAKLSEIKSRREMLARMSKSRVKEA